MLLAWIDETVTLTTAGKILIFHDKKKMHDICPLLTFSHFPDHLRLYSITHPDFQIFGTMWQPYRSHTNCRPGPISNTFAKCARKTITHYSLEKVAIAVQMSQIRSLAIKQVTVNPRSGHIKGMHGNAVPIAKKSTYRNGMAFPLLKWLRTHYGRH